MGDFVVAGELRIGREQAANEIVLSDPAISRTHARVMRERGEFVFEDLASTNGSHLITSGGRQLLAGRQTLRGGDRIQVGSFQLTFQLPS